MKLVLASNYLNAHMKPLCEAFKKNAGVESFAFIATVPFEEERIKMGFANEQDKTKYVYKAYEGAEQYEVALKLVQAADVAIIAHAPDEFVHARMKEDKLTFLCTERFYKLGLWRRFVPSSYIKKQNRFLQYRDKNLYYLTIGAYLPFDLYLVGFPLEKCFQWAYFPELEPMDEAQLEKKNNSGVLKLFWAGRMVQLKHPETAIAIAKHFKRSKISFELNMAGDGAILPRMQRMVEKERLGESVHLLGNCTPEKVQQYMQESDIFLFTSNYCEGWGAVLSEAMGAGCVPIASVAAGASEILIRSGYNGVIYNTEKEAVQMAVDLVLHPTERKKMAKAAYQTVHMDWSPEKAVKHFVKAVSDMQSGVIAKGTDGPMAPAILRKAKNYLYTDI